MVCPLTCLCSHDALTPLAAAPLTEVNLKMLDHASTSSEGEGAVHATVALQRLHKWDSDAHMQGKTVSRSSTPSDMVFCELMALIPGLRWFLQTPWLCAAANCMCQAAVHSNQ